MRKIKLDYIVADAAGNITGFIIYPADPRLRVPYGIKMMEELKEYNIEQVGFISPSFEGKPLRMDMMGGEFCGNATRSYGYYAAKCEGIEGKDEIEVFVSGHKGPLYVKVDMDKQTSSVEMPRARKISIVEINSKNYKAVIFDGIVHVVIEEEEDRKLALKVIDEVQKIYENDAYGAIFFDREKGEVVPYVYVKEADTLFREGSCASGTAAVATVLTEDLKDNKFKRILKFPAGELEISAIKAKDGKFTISIGGKVQVTENKQFEISIDDDSDNFVNNN